jgi:glycosyltransferase involved in cell wall biosynthesis
VLVPPRQAGAWADVVVDLMGNPSRRAAMGAAGRTKAAVYAWPRVAERILEVYQRVLE